MQSRCLGDKVHKKVVDSRSMNWVNTFPFMNIFQCITGYTDPKSSWCHYLLWGNYVLYSQQNCVSIYVGDITDTRHNTNFLFLTDAMSCTTCTFICCFCQLIHALYQFQLWLFLYYFLLFYQIYWKLLQSNFNCIQ